MLVFAQPGKVLAILSGPDGQRFLVDTWETAGKHCAPEGRRDPDGLGLSISPTGTTGLVAVVRLPAPTQVPEAHFVAIFGRFATPGQPDPGQLKWVRIFTLELGTHPLTEAPCTMLCEWTDAGDHKNYGEGPPPDEELFVEAALDLIWQQIERAAQPE
jgi:hypothetical protein